MKKNMGNTDRLIRLMLGVVFGILYFNNMVAAPWGLILLVIGIVFFVTGLVGFCPIYRLVGITTCPIKKTS